MNAQEQAQLRVGTAKVDITPSDLTGLTNLWGSPFQDVHDAIYARVLLLDNGINSAVIVAADLLEFGDTLSFRQSIEAELGIPATNIVLTASHAHNTPRAGVVTEGASAKIGGLGTAANTQFLYAKILHGIERAQATLQPARVGVSTGHADVNTNRQEYTKDGWRLGVNPNGPSDKTVWVVKFESMNGKPIAILINYAVHAVVLGPESQFITGDLPGVTERYVEEYFGGDVVALWTIGAAGDQNPKYMGWDTTYTQKDREDGYPLMEALARVVGEEVVAAAERMPHMTDAVRIAAEERVVTCPTKPPEEQHGPHTIGVEELPIRLGLILVNQIAITSVSGEVSTLIYYHLKQDSPFTNTIMITMANDRVGYIVEDAAYGTQTFEMRGTPFAAGCAESAIVHTLVEMMEQY